MSLSSSSDLWALFFSSLCSRILLKIKQSTSSFTVEGIIIDVWLSQLRFGDDMNFGAIKENPTDLITF